MESSNIVAIVTTALLVVSEALPFLRRHLKTKVPIDGIIFAIFCMLYVSNCIDDECTHRAESVLGRDIDGDGIIGKTESHEESTHVVNPERAAEPSSCQRPSQGDAAPSETLIPTAHSC